MSDIGELVVKLTMESGTVAQQIRAIQREVKGLQSSFQSGAGGMMQYATAQAKTQAQIENVQRQLGLQKQAVEISRQAMEAAKTTLNSSVADQKKYATELGDAKAKNQELRDAINQQKAAMSASKQATGDNTEEYISMSLELDRLNGELKESDAEVAKVQKQYDKMGSTIATAAEKAQYSEGAYKKQTAAQREMEQELDRLNTRLKMHIDTLEAASQKLTAYGEKTTAIGQAQTRTGQALTRGVTTPILAAGAAAVTASVTWESAFAGVRKTVNGTAEELAGVEQGLRDMSKEIPTVNTELAGIAENAGQLGVATGEVLGFTKTIAALKETTNLTAEAGAKDFAQFANVTKMQGTAENYQRLGSTVVELGNNLATTEADIVGMAMNLASAGTQAGMTQAQIMGVAGALSSLGLEAQGGGTAISRTLIAMQVGVETGSEALKDYADIAGMTVNQFSTLFKKDAASALTAFITGLSSGSDSAIKMLTDMEITETRQRDALTRSANAAELFAGSIGMATEAWKENTALSKEAEVRYQTTESRMAMMANKAKDTAITFGNDLLPALEKGVDWAGELVDGWGKLDEATRANITTWAGLAAAVGPSVMVIGKANTAIGKTATTLGKFTQAMATGGGGVRGFWAACKGLLGPAGVIALGAAAIAGAVYWYDYASGAKAAREALEGMQETADKWSNTDANTFYGGGQGLGAFGMSEKDFAPAAASSKAWFDELKKVWSDGEKETDGIVTQFTDQFKGKTQTVREALEGLRGDAAGSGSATGLVGDIDKDLTRLDQLDKTVEGLLKKKQNGLLSEGDEETLQNAIDEREAITVKYNLEPEAGGYEKIISDIKAAEERANAGGGEVDSEVYKEGALAMAEGRKAYNDQLTESYNKEYALIQLMGDEEAKQQALGELNANYQRQREEGAKQYAQALGETAPELLQGEEMRKSQEDMANLMDLIAQYNAETDRTKQGDILGQMDALTKGMDEGKITEYLALISQVKEAVGEAGLTPEETSELFPEIDISSILGDYSTIGEFLKAHMGEEKLEGLDQMFNDAIPKELQKITAELDMTTVNKQWADFSSNPGSITAEVEGIPDSLPINATATVTQATITDGLKAEGITADAEITAYKVMESLQAKIDAGATITKADIQEGLELAGVIPAKAEAIAAALAAGVGITEPIGATASVNEANIAAGLTVNGEIPADAEIIAATVMETLKPKIDAGATITQADIQEGLELAGVIPAKAEAIAAALAAGVSITEPIGATANVTEATITAGLKAEGITADAEIVAATVMESLQPKIDAGANITEADIKEGLLDADIIPAKAEVIAASLAAGLGIVEPIPLSGQVNGIEVSASVINAFKASHMIGMDAKVRLAPAAMGDVKKAFEAGKLKVFGTDGAKITATAEVVNKLTSADLAATEADGTVTVWVTPKYGTPEYRETTKAPLEEGGGAGDVIPSVTSEMEMLTAAVDAYNKALEAHDAGAISGTFSDLASIIDILGADPAKMEQIGADISALMGIINNPESSPDSIQAATDALTSYKTAIEGIIGLTGLNSTGEDVAAGIGAGMIGYSYAGDAGTMAAQMLADINSACGVASPSTKTKPIGMMVSAGIAAGMMGFSFAGAGAVVGAMVTLSVSSLPAKGVTAGQGFARGIASGITSGTSWIVAAARQAAQAAVTAAQNALNNGGGGSSGGKGLTGKGLSGSGVNQKVPDVFSVIEAGSRAVASKGPTYQTYKNNANIEIRIEKADLSSTKSIREVSEELGRYIRKEAMGMGG